MKFGSADRDNPNPLSRISKRLTQVGAIFATLFLIALSACAGKEIPVSIDGSCDFMRLDFTDPALLRTNDQNKRAVLFNDEIWMARCLPKGALSAGGPR